MITVVMFYLYILTDLASSSGHLQWHYPRLYTNDEVDHATKVPGWILILPILIPMYALAGLLDTAPCMLHELMLFSLMCL